MGVVQVIRDLAANPPDWEVARAHPAREAFVDVICPAMRHGLDGADMLSIVVPPPGCDERGRDQLRERFRRECAALHALQHEAIPHIYENESHEGYPFLVMEYAAGATMGKAFRTLLSEGGWGAVFKMARQVASPGR